MTTETDYDKQAYDAVINSINANFKDSEKLDVFRALLEHLSFNIKGLVAEEKDEPFDWSASPKTKYDSFIVNTIFGDVLMEYTIKASCEEIVDLDIYLAHQLTREVQ